ncbi:MAG: response regulator, partial [Candidatus Hinthialibacter sp.]
MVSSGNSVDDSLVRRAVLFEVKQDNLMESKKHISQSNLIQLVDETDDVEKLIFLLKKNNPDIIFLSTDNLNGEGNVTINKIRRYNQQVCIVAMGTKDETQAVLQYFRAGADEYLMKPIQRDELLSLLGRISAKPKYTHQKNLSFGKTIAVWGCRGGSGVTTIAANAAYLQQQSSPTILVDLHIEQGDLSLFFNMRNMNYSVKDLFDANSTFDEILVDNVTTQYK